MAAVPSGSTEDVKPLAENSQCTESEFSDKPPEWPDLLMPHVVTYYLSAGPEYTDVHPNRKPSSFSEKRGKLNASVIASDNIIDQNQPRHIAARDLGAPQS